MIVSAAVFALWTAGIEARLVYLQIFSHDELVTRAERQQMETQEVPAKRGEIYDRRGRLLAYSVDADTVYAVPYKLTDVASVAAALCEALDDCSAKDRTAYLARLNSKRAFVYVKRRVSPDEARRVAALNLEGIGFVKESRRFYPNRELAAHLLGYVGLDNIGLAGIEAAYDKVVRGKPGTVLVQTDARRQAFSRLERTPTSGGSLELTIDQQLQYIVERELRAGVELNRAVAGTAVVMDPHSGEILAMASWPSFNPNAYAGSVEAARRNRAVQDLYEPGSTFKVVTASAALEERLMPPDAMIDTNPGVVRFKGSVVDEYGGKNYGVLSFTDVLVRSSNVGAIKIGLQLGPERLGLYVQRFGFGRPTSPDFPGESPGIVHDSSRLNDRALASVSMGYQVGVTPLQMAAAMSAVANGGNWIEPRVVRALVRDGVRTKVTPKIVRRVISRETVLELTPILEKVVEDGTAKKAQIPGFTVAGKTGTADKLVNGRYSNIDQNVSFVGFAPSRNPAITVIVMIDTPRGGPDTGGAVAAPLFRRIAEASLRHLGVPANVNAPAPLIVESREPSPLTQTSALLPPSIVTLTASDAQASLVPDFRGLNARDAVRALARVGLTARIEGAGIVVQQHPAPGTPLERGATCTLLLDRDPPRPTPPGAQP